MQNAASRAAFLLAVVFGVKLGFELIRREPTLPVGNRILQLAVFRKIPAPAVIILLGRVRITIKVDVVFKVSDLYLGR